MQKTKDEVTFASSDILAAVLFHLEDEGWFNPVPWELKKWLTRKLDPEVEFIFDRHDWRSRMSGTHRLLWILIACNLDPYYICHFKSGAAAKIMHERFSNVIQSYNLADKT